MSEDNGAPDAPPAPDPWWIDAEEERFAEALRRFANAPRRAPPETAE